MECPLCNSANYHAVSTTTKRDFYKCENCQLIFTNPADYPLQENEKSRYELHQNTVEDEGYVSFLNKAITPALPYLTASMRGLDYGCGPNPTLSKLLKKQGVTCDDYDPFFYPIELQQQYNFIFSTECFEHFHHPKQELEKISGLLVSGGILTIMTDQWKTEEQFANWYYTTDKTHVCFYHANTFNYMIEKFNFNLLFTDNERVIILEKQ